MNLNYYVGCFLSKVSGYFDQNQVLLKARIFQLTVSEVSELII